MNVSSKKLNVRNVALSDIGKHLRKQNGYWDNRLYIVHPVHLSNDRKIRYLNYILDIGKLPKPYINRKTNINKLKKTHMKTSINTDQLQIRNLSVNSYQNVNAALEIKLFNLLLAMYNNFRYDNYIARIHLYCRDYNVGSIKADILIEMKLIKEIGCAEKYRKYKWITSEPTIKTAKELRLKLRKIRKQYHLNQKTKKFTFTSVMQDIYTMLPEKFNSIEGVKLTKELGYSHSTFYTLVNNENYFKKSGRNYIKIIDSEQKSLNILPKQESYNTKNKLISDNIPHGSNEMIYKSLPNQFTIFEAIEIVEDLKISRKKLYTLLREKNRFDQKGQSFTKTISIHEFWKPTNKPTKVILESESKTENNTKKEIKNKLISFFWGMFKIEIKNK